MILPLFSSFSLSNFFVEHKKNISNLGEINNMNTPELKTERLILRKFTDRDINALFLILKDEEVNTFLPWFPVKNKVLLQKPQKP